MSGRLSNLLLGTLIEIDCPVCGFGSEVEMMDAVCQVWRWCPCCRTRIRLVDDWGGLHGAIEQIDASRRELENALGRLYG